MEQQNRMCRTIAENKYSVCVREMSTIAVSTAYPGADAMALNGGHLYPENNAYLGCWGCARLDALFLMGVRAGCACVWNIFLLSSDVDDLQAGARWEPEMK